MLWSAENRGKIAHSDTKTPILCSKGLKMGVLEGKSAQKSRFCARKPEKPGFRRLKAHKNGDFVLGKLKNGGPEGQKRTKIAILCSRREGIGTRKHNRGLPANHRARECAPEVPRTGIRVLGDLLELHPRLGGSLITHRIPAPQPGNSLIWRRYGGGVGNRCRWADRFASV